MYCFPKRNYSRKSKYNSTWSKSRIVLTVRERGTRLSVFTTSPAFLSFSVPSLSLSLSVLRSPACRLQPAGRESGITEFILPLPTLSERGHGFSNSYCDNWHGCQSFKFDSTSKKQIGVCHKLGWGTLLRARPGIYVVHFAAQFPCKDESAEICSLFCSVGG